MAGDRYRRMGKSHEEAKTRVLAIDRMLRYDRRITAAEITRRLHDVYGIECDRKTVYHDICAINRITPIDGATGCNGGFQKINVLEALEDGK